MSEILVAAEALAAALGIRFGDVSFSVVDGHVRFVKKTETLHITDAPQEHQVLG